MFRNKKWLKNNYHQKRFSTRKIAEMCNCSHKTILYWLNKFKIKIRKKGEARRGISLSEETREKLRKANLGKKMSPESIKKMSEALKGRKFSEEHKKRISISQKGKKKSEEHKKKLSESLKDKYSGVNSFCWKGGRSKDSGNYILIYKPNHLKANYYGYVLEHRLIAERVLGRLLKSNEHIHHINGNRQDNRNSNLLVCNSDYHKWLHHQMLNFK